MATEPNNNRSDTPNGHENGDGSQQTVTLRMLMQGKEAGSIIGKKGENVKKFRDESGAKINISDSSCPERIVTVTGFIEQIQAAFGMICKKFEDDMITLQQLQAQLQGQPTNNLPRPIVAIRLIIPASQCGSLIGKGGAKIKEIRDAIASDGVTGASIQVASDMLPNSTERAVTVTGSAHAIALAIFHVCTVLMESPPKGATIPYRPKPAVPPVIYTQTGQAIAMQPGQFISPTEPSIMSSPLGYNMINMQRGMMAYTPVSCSQNTHQQMKALGFQPGTVPPGMFVQIAHPGMMPAGAYQPIYQAPIPIHYAAGPDPSAYAQYKTMDQLCTMTSAPVHDHLAHDRSVNSGWNMDNLSRYYMECNQAQEQWGRGGQSPVAMGATGMQGQMQGRPNLVPASQVPSSAQTQEMTIPNDLIGCIIGRGGSKINEIRQLSGAMIKISNVEENAGERKVTITGTPETINTAQYLINCSMELHKQLNLVAAASADTVLSLPPSATAAAAAYHLPPQFLAPMSPGAYQTKPYPPNTVFVSSASLPIGYEGQQHALTTKLKVGSGQASGDGMSGQTHLHHPHHVAAVTGRPLASVAVPVSSVLGKDPKYAPY